MTSYGICYINTTENREKLSPLTKNVNNGYLSNTYEHLNKEIKCATLA
jgi:hypothetical protein